MKDPVHKYDHLEGALNADLLQFYDSPEEDENTIANDLASIDKRYSDFELLAEGGTKRVYKAMDNVVKRHIAYAQLIDNDKEHHESFLREARLTSLLQHPGIISVLDMGLEEEKPFFTMELKVGNSLGFILKKIAKSDEEFIALYPLKKLLNIFIKICDAVDYAHSQEIIHLDLKPDNIQVGEFGEVIVCDWGLGKLISTQDLPGIQYESLAKTQTLNGVIKGTPGFMAPEQIDSKGDKKEATDIYSLGAILYNILTLRPPVDGSLEEILKKTLSGDFKDPIEVKKEIPESLNAVTLKALGAKAQDRYKTVKKLKSEVEKYLSGFATSAENASLLKQVYLFYQRNKVLCWTVSTALAIYFFSSVLFINQISDEKNEAIKQKLNAEQAKAETETAYKKELLARQEAEENLRMYEEQKVLSTNYKQRILDQSKAFIRRKMYLPEINHRSFVLIARDLHTLFEREPESLDVKKSLGYFYFIMQKYSQAEKLLEESENYEYLVKILKEFHKQVPYKKQYDTADTIILMNLLFEKRKEKGLFQIVQLMRYEAMQLKHDLDDVIQRVFEIFNSESHRFKLKKKEEYLELGTAGQGLIISHENYNFLRNLKLRHLKLNGKLDKIRTLSQLRFHILDISDCEVEDLEFLRTFFSIKVLYVRKNQLAPELMAYLKKYIEVIEKSSI